MDRGWLPQVPVVPRQTPYENGRLIGDRAAVPFMHLQWKSKGKDAPFALQLAAPWLEDMLRLMREVTGEPGGLHSWRAFHEVWRRGGYAQLHLGFAVRADRPRAGPHPIDTLPGSAEPRHGRMDYSQWLALLYESACDLFLCPPPSPTAQPFQSVIVQTYGAEALAAFGTYLLEHLFHTQLPHGGRRGHGEKCPHSGRECPLANGAAGADEPQLSKLLPVSLRPAAMAAIRAAVAHQEREGQCDLRETVEGLLHCQAVCVAEHLRGAAPEQLSTLLMLHYHPGWTGDALYRSCVVQGQYFGDPEGNIRSQRVAPAWDASREAQRRWKAVRCAMEVTPDQEEWLDQVGR